MTNYVDGSGQPLNYFVATDEDNRVDTAVLLVGTATEHGVDQHDIAAASDGFWISDKLAHILYPEGDQSEDPAPAEPETPAEAPAEAPADAPADAPAEAPAEAPAQ